MKKTLLLLTACALTVILAVTSVYIPEALNRGKISSMASTRPGHVDADPDVPIGEHGVRVDSKVFEFGKISVSMTACWEAGIAGFEESKVYQDGDDIVIELGDCPTYPKITGLSIGGFSCSPCGQCYDKDGCDKECGCEEECQEEHCHMPMGGVKVNGPGAKYCLAGCNFCCRANISASFSDGGASVTIADLVDGGCLWSINIVVTTEFAPPSEPFNGFEPCDPRCTDASGNPMPNSNITTGSQQCCIDGDLGVGLESLYDEVSSNGYDIVGMHGMPNSVAGFENVICEHQDNPDDCTDECWGSLVGVLKLKGYGHQPIRLISCMTGMYPDGVAAQLSAGLLVQVTAPRNVAQVFSDGRVGVPGSINGEIGMVSSTLIFWLLLKVGVFSSELGWNTFYPDGCGDPENMYNSCHICDRPPTCYYDDCCACSLLGGTNVGICLEGSYCHIHNDWDCSALSCHWCNPPIFCFQKPAR